MFAHICCCARSTVEMWAGPAVGTLDPNRNSRQRRMRGRRGVRVLVAPVGPAHDLQFACALVRSTGGASRIESARQRFARIIAQLSLTPDDGSITVGFAQLVRGDSPMDLIDRADRQLIAARNTTHEIKSTTTFSDRASLGHGRPMVTVRSARRVAPPGRAEARSRHAPRVRHTGRNGGLARGCLRSRREG